MASLEQLCALGLSDSRVRKRAGAGRLHRVHRAVYSLVPPAHMTLRARFMAAALACGPGAVLSHRSAAWLHAIRRTERARIDVTVPGRSGRERPGLEIHRSTILTSADVTVLDGIPVTTVARTLADLAAVLPDRAVQRALEQAAALHVLDGRAVEAQIATHPRGSTLARLTAAGGLIEPPTESALEERFLSVCHQAGVPEPRRQFRIDPGDGAPMIRADFAWPAARLIVEADGAAHHHTRHAFETDRRRDQRLQAAGWRVIRITWRQLTERPWEVVALLRSLLLARAA